MKLFKVMILLKNTAALGMFTLTIPAHDRFEAMRVAYLQTPLSCTVIGVIEVPFQQERAA